MLSVKGKFKDGVARPEEPVSGREGQAVIITFLEETRAATRIGVEEAKDRLMDDPEALSALYEAAREEDRDLAWMGLDSYLQLLHQEDENT